MVPGRWFLFSTSSVKDLWLRLSIRERGHRSRPVCSVRLEYSLANRNVAHKLRQSPFKHRSPFQPYYVRFSINLVHSPQGSVNTVTTTALIFCWFHLLSLYECTIFQWITKWFFYVFSLIYSHMTLWLRQSDCLKPLLRYKHASERASKEIGQIVICAIMVFTKHICKEIKNILPKTQQENKTQYPIDL